MAAFRQTSSIGRWIAVALVAIALLMKLAVPPGYMIGSVRGVPAIELCSGTGAMPAMAMPDRMHGHRHERGHMSDRPCPAAALTMHGLAGADPLLPVAATLFMIALALFVRPASVRRTYARLRPPLRGPPART